MIGIIDMKTNNINCFIKIVKKSNIEYKIIRTFSDYDEKIEKIIIPGIGSYNNTIKYLISSELDKVIIKHNEDKKKILAVCIGMQILTEYGDEGGKINGLGLFKKTYTEKMNSDYILPNIGWNNIILKDRDNILMDGIPDDSDFYFVHSYNVKSLDEGIIYAKSYYGKTEFISILKSDNILATQFHPEKSGPNGIKLIKNFFKW